MRGPTIAVVGVLCILLFTIGAGPEGGDLQPTAGDYYEDWLWDTAGWFAGNNYTVVEHRPTGGNGQGYLSFAADDDAPMLGLAIEVTTDLSQATGDYSAARIASVSFDLLFLESPYFYFYQAASFKIQYETPGGAVENAWRFPLQTTFPLGSWESFTIPVDRGWSDADAEAAGWVRDVGGTASFSQALTSVYRPKVYIEGRGAMSAGVDNFRLRGGPAADAGPDQYVGWDDDVILDGSESHDPTGGGLVSYSWSEISGRFGCEYSSEDVVYNVPLPDNRVNSYIFELIACNADGACGRDTVIVNVLEDEESAVFVASGGSDVGLGTPDDPVATLATAIAMASATSPRSDIYVESATFPITSTLAILDTVSLYGGYSVVPTVAGGYHWKREAGQRTVVGDAVTGPGTVLSIQNVQDGYMAVDGFHFVAGPGVDGVDAAGGNSIGVYVRNCGTNLQISNNMIDAGPGGDGAPVPDGEEGWAGWRGYDGQDGDKVQVNTANVAWNLVSRSGQDLGVISDLTDIFQSVAGPEAGGAGAWSQICSSDFKERPAGYVGGYGGGRDHQFNAEYLLVCLPPVAALWWNPAFAQAVGCVFAAGVMTYQFAAESHVYAGENGDGNRYGDGLGGAAGGWGSSQELNLALLQELIDAAAWLAGEDTFDIPDVIPFKYGEDGEPGGQGSRGLDGPDGVGGDSGGYIYNGTWVGSSGTPGEDGENGGSGGGGGAGHFGIGVSMELDLPPQLSAYWLAGGTGGGGGGGGCGGDGGLGGFGGGGSFGIFLMNSEPMICNNLISTGPGGAGSAGRAGRAGGDGRNGGFGGEESSVFLGQFHSGKGGDGGAGGDGGEGGNGGGGGGGASVGIYGAGHLSRVIGRIGDNDYAIGPGGPGGDGGASPLLDGANGLSLRTFPEVTDLTDTTYAIVFGPPTEQCIGGGGMLEGGNRICFMVPGAPVDTIVIAGVVSTCCRECFDGCLSLSGIDLDVIGPDGGLALSTASSTTSQVTIQRGPTFVAFEIVDPEPGMWSLAFTGNDVPDEGLEVSVKLDAYEPNLPPIADAGEDRVLECGSAAGTSYVLNGSASRDGDPVPSALAYEWYDANMNLVGTAARVPVALPLGESTFYLDVFDHWGASSTDTVTLTVQDTTPPVITPPSNIVVAPAECDASPADSPELEAFFGSLVVEDRCDDHPSVSNDAPGVLPLGVTRVVFTATDGVGNTDVAAAYVTVLDTLPPSIDVTLSRDVLWPPNHKMADIIASVMVEDNCDSALVYELVSITSNEPDDGKGDGHTTGDIDGVEWGMPDTAFQLRAERSGTGDGRLYTVIYGAYDAAGNSTFDTSYVRVPVDNEGSAMASLGFNSDGSGFDASSGEFVLVVPSRPGTVQLDGHGDPMGFVAGFDATQIDYGTAYVGNLKGVVTPARVATVDNNTDGLDDLALFYDVEAVQALVSASTSGGKIKRRDGAGPIGLHYTGGPGGDYVVPSIFDLGAPVALLDVSFIGEQTGTVEVVDVTGEPETNVPPKTTGLRGVYPNPFNPSTTVKFDLFRAAHVDLRIYDARGKLVRTLADTNLPAGEHRVVWNGVDNRGNPAATGVYFVRLLAAGYEGTMKMVLLK